MYNELSEAEYETVIIKKFGLDRNALRVTFEEMKQTQGINNYKLFLVSVFEDYFLKSLE